MQHTWKPDAWVLSVYIKETDVVHVVTYPARISTPEYAGGRGPFKELWCSKCSALSPFWSSHIVWQTEEAVACRQLGVTLWSNRLLATCGSEAKQSSCNSSHTLPDKQHTVNVGIYIYQSPGDMLILTGLRESYEITNSASVNFLKTLPTTWQHASDEVPGGLPEVSPPTPLVGHQSADRWPRMLRAECSLSRSLVSDGVDACAPSDLLEGVL